MRFVAFVTYEHRNDYYVKRKEYIRGGYKGEEGVEIKVKMGQQRKEQDDC